MGWWWLAALALARCTPAASQSDPPLGAAPAPAPASPFEALALESRALPLASLHLGFVPGFAMDETRWPRGGVYAQSLVNGDERLQILVRAAPDESLRGALEDYRNGWDLGAIGTVRVCGRDAQRVHATREAQHITCVIATSGPNHPAYVPRTEVDIVAFEHRGLTVVLRVEIASDSPQAFRGFAPRVLASLRCDG
jgi:hypothetical protein